MFTIDSELYWLVWDQVGKDTAFGIIMKIATGTLIFALFSVLYSTKICQIQLCLDDSWYKITHSRLTVGLNYSFLALFWLSGSWLDTYWICQILYWVSSLPWDSFSSCPLSTGYGIFTPAPGWLSGCSGRFWLISWTPPPPPSDCFSSCVFNFCCFWFYWFTLAWGWPPPPPPPGCSPSHPCAPPLLQCCLRRFGGWGKIILKVFVTLFNTRWLV